MSPSCFDRVRNLRTCGQFSLRPDHSRDSRKSHPHAAPRGTRAASTGHHVRISGFLAGVAGGLSAQVTQLVALDLLFVLSGNALIMVILGGIGSLNGAILGAALFVLISDRAAAISPFHWLFALGIALILTVRYAPAGLIGFLQRRGFR